MSARSLILTDGVRSTILDPADAERFGCLSLSYVNGYVCCRPYDDNRTEYLHRLILDAPSGMDVDHINGDGLDNRRANLRVVTRSQNLWNSAASGTTSRFKGVSWITSAGRYRVQIKASGKSHYIGYFDDEADAARAYDEAARNLHGEYGSYNFPRPGEQSALRSSITERHRTNSESEAA